MFTFTISAETLGELQDKMEKYLTAPSDLHPELPTIPTVPVQQFDPTSVKPTYIPKVTYHTPSVAKDSADYMLNHNKPRMTITQVEVDVDGMPWDARIHSMGQSKTIRGVWKYKKGVKDELIAQVEEIKTPVQQTTVSLPPPPAPTIHVEMPSFTTPPVQAPVVAAQEPAPAPSPAYEDFPTPEGVKPAHSLATFEANLTMVLAQLINDKKITPAYVESVKNHFGNKEIWDVLKNRGQLIELYEQFCAQGLITRVEM